MATAHDLAAAAREMKAAQDDAAQIEPFTQRIPAFDLAAAYEVAHRVHAMRVAEGATAVGRKIGFTNPAMWERFGVREPIWGTICDTTVEYVGATEVECDLTGFAEPRIEPEVVIRFRDEPPVGAGVTGLAGAIDWVAHGFEIVQSHFPGWRFTAADTVADAALHGRLLIGPVQPVRALGADPVGALETFALVLSRDGEPVATGTGADVLDSPLAAVAHLQSVLAAQPSRSPLRAGEIVTTGTITTAQAVRAGETWRSALEGIALPGLTVRFTGQS